MRGSPSSRCLENQRPLDPPSLSTSRKPLSRISPGSSSLRRNNFTLPSQENGAGGGTRTRTLLRVVDFKSTVSAIPPPRHGIYLGRFSKAHQHPDETHPYPNLPPSEREGFRGALPERRNLLF